MSGTLTYPVEDLRQLIIEVMSGDGVVRGSSSAAEIEVVYRGDDRSAQFARVDDGVRFYGAKVERVVVPQSLHVAVNAGMGDLRVQNLSGEISLDDVRGDLRLEALSGQVVLSHAAGDIRADEVAELQILGACAGDLRFSGGNIAGQTVAGDLRIVDAGSLRLRQVHGDLWLERLSGSVEVEHISGDARLADIAGPTNIGELFGDLRATSMTGGLDAPQVNGDAILEGEFGEDSSYSVTANGDLHLALAAAANVQLSVGASGRIRSDLPLTPADDGTPVFTATLGEGAASVRLTARGDVRITQAGASGADWQRQSSRKSDPFGDLDNLGDRIRQQVYASLTAAGINVETGEINLGRHGRFRPPRPPVPPARPARPEPPAPPERPRSADRGRASGAGAGASSEEQLAVLKMVQEGRITAEEAEVLLRALGNG